jgi:hypothetical protein
MLRKYFPQLLAVLLTALAVFSVMSVTPKPIDQQPIPDAREYADSAQRLANGQGFVQAWERLRPQPPRYSPGLPIALAPFGKVSPYPEGIQKGASAMVVLYVLVIVFAAWSLAGPLGGAFAAALILLSPFARTSAALVMSDAFGAALMVAVVPLLVLRTRAGDRLAGALLGFVATVRIIAGVGLIAMLFAIPGRASKRRVLLWAAPFIVGLFLIQWVMFGNPLSTGYDRWDAGFAQMFAIGNPFHGAAAEGLSLFPEPTAGHLIDSIGPVGLGGAPATGMQNIFFYPVVLLGLLWIYTPPLVTVIGLVYGWRHRAEPAVRYALLTIAGTVFVYFFYEYQAARLIAAPASLLLVLTAAGLARGVAWAQRFETVWWERAAAAGDVGAAAGSREVASATHPRGGW